MPGSSSGTGSGGEKDIGTPTGTDYVSVPSSPDTPTSTEPVATDPATTSLTEEQSQEEPSDSEGTP